MTKQQIQRVAEGGSKLSLSEDGVQIVAGVVGFMSTLGRANKLEEPHDRVLGMKELADDVVGKSLPIEKVMQNTKTNRGRYFVVPIVVD